MYAEADRVSNVGERNTNFFNNRSAAGPGKNAQKPRSAGQLPRIYDTREGTRLARRDDGTNGRNENAYATSERQAGRIATVDDVVVGGTGLAAGRRSRAAGRAPMTTA